ncbi:polysaccharide pyruvyl transferase family protein [Streptomyces sp. NPDC058374]|uniref:polysaccharide pyruvyl transferase family protein n=1 Tax=Streptomyces sp. NPDC058374 TaxID=3346466 RepID=UPI0036529F06
MTDPMDEVIATLRDHPDGPQRLLITGWFSFEDGEVTAGDVLALRAAQEALTRAGIVHDTAWSAGFRADALHLDAAEPDEYGHLLFVCGPLHGEQIKALHRRYARCRRLAVDVSVVDPDAPEVAGFDLVVARDGVGRPRADLSVRAPLGPPPPVVGVVLTGGQGEYGAARRHEAVGALLERWVGGRDCARVPAETRLDSGDWRLCATPEQFLALVGGWDLVLTTRLHGLVLSLRAGVPVLAVDPVAGGAKVSAQARALRWPATLTADTVCERLLDRWWAWCLSPAGRDAARRRARLMGPGV